MTTRRPRVYLDLESQRASARLIIELFSDKAPENAENFRALCTGEKGKTEDGVRLRYRGTKLHRIVAPEFLIQGGDITKGDGTGGISIHGRPLADENVNEKLDSPGFVCMANSGPNTNLSQFFITLCPTEWLEGSCTTVGKVVKGLDELEDFQEILVDDDDSPLVGEEATISKSGELRYISKRARSRSPKKEVHAEIRSRPSPSTSSYRQRSPSGAEHRRQTSSSSRREDGRRSDYRESRESRPKQHTRDDPNSIILKGRGTMKYRERSKQYGRLT